MNFEKLNQKDLAFLCGVSIRTIQNWHDREIPRNGEGRGVSYQWAVVRPWWLAFEAGKDGPSGSDDFERARARKMMDAGEAEQAWGGFLRGLQSNLMGLPDRVAPDLEDGMTLMERREVMRKAMIESLTALVAEAHRAAGLSFP